MVARTTPSDVTPAPTTGSAEAESPVFGAVPSFCVSVSCVGIISLYFLLVSVLVFLVFLHLDSPAVPVSDLVSPAVPASNLILPSSACDTFEEIMKLRQDGEFLFEQNGKRIRGNAFNKHLSRICEKLDIPHRTMHKNLTTYHFSRKRKMPETL